MKKAECEKAIRPLCHQWGTRAVCRPSCRTSVQYLCGRNDEHRNCDHDEPGGLHKVSAACVLDKDLARQESNEKSMAPSIVM